MTFFATARSVLFLPGTRLDILARALASEADAVVIDLEDAVAETDKDTARAAVMAALAAGAGRPGVRLGVRINPLGSAAGIHDLSALLRLDEPPPLIALPKVGCAAEVRLCAAALGASWRGGLLCAVETAAGLRRADAIAAAGPRVAALGFGGVDFAAELGVAPAWEPLLTARSRIAAAAAGAGVAAWDMPRLALDGDEDLAAECRRSRALGFHGKIAIHPAQVAVINREFRPAAAEVAEARAVIAAADGGRAVRHGRSMVDAAVVRRAQRVIDAAERSGS